MQSTAKTPQDYVVQLPEERKLITQELRKIITNNLPLGFEETMQYGMISYVVPHSIYPDGYHCNPKEPLPFISLASQKNHIALYHMGIYSDPALLNWFINEFPKHASGKLDMGKSCIRFKNLNTIPLDLLGELCAKMTVKDWIAMYEKTFKK